MKFFKKLRYYDRTYCPRVLPYALLWAAISAGLLIAADSNTALAQNINYWYGSVIRIVMAYLTMWIPFSVAEFLLLASPVLLFALVYYFVCAAKHGHRAVIRSVLAIVCILAIIFSLYVPGLALGYKEPSITEKLELEDEPVSTEELSETADWLIREANKLCTDVDFVFGGASEMPFSDITDMCSDLNIGYQRVHQDYPIFISFYSHVKPVVMSVPMSYTHLTGIYTFFTGESNLNINFPDFTLPYTAAHEMAHQRGIIRENEANLMAFLVTIQGESPYTRYSGYVNMIQYFLNALYSADQDLYYEKLDDLDIRIRYELQAYSDFYDTYRDSEAGKVTNSLNDSYLKAQGLTEGTKSYGLVVDLTVAYYKTVILGGGS